MRSNPWPRPEPPFHQGWITFDYASVQRLCRLALG